REPKVIRLGEEDFDRIDESLAFDFDIADITVHPGYRLPEKYNDIAIITLKQQIEFTNNLQPFCLPRPNINLDGEICTVSGWGTMPNEPAARIIHNVNVQVVNQNNCAANYVVARSFTPIFTIQYPNGISNELLCAGVINDVCRGDSGGPLVFSDPSGKLEEVGVVSTGYGCGDARIPGIYTKVGQYLEWINQVTFSGCGN
ncbi:unnamed protein product, partial [Meganyctiphanes norvegica]